jgi:hypothetical protein
MKYDPTRLGLLHYQNPSPCFKVLDKFYGYYGMPLEKIILRFSSFTRNNHALLVPLNIARMFVLSMGNLTRIVQGSRVRQSPFCNS